LYLSQVLGLPAKNDIYTSDFRVKFTPQKTEIGKGKFIR
jgi:hypothetical protein